MFVWGTRIESPVLIGGGLLILALLSLLYKSRAAICGLSIGLIFLYPAPISGWAYGNDTLDVATVTKIVLESGWPVQGYSLSGFTQTPILHIYTAITSLITGVPIVPGADGKLLVTFLLPLIFSGLVLATIWVVLRAYAGTRELATYGMFSVLMWFPLFQFTTALRRGAAGLLIFSLVFCCLYIFYQRQNVQILPLLGVFLLVSPATHHFASMVISIITLLFAAAVYYRGKQSRTERYTKALLIVAFAAPTLTVLYQFLAGFGSEYTLGIFQLVVNQVVNILPVEEVLELISGWKDAGTVGTTGGGQPGGSETPPPEISNGGTLEVITDIGLVTLLRRIAVWVYAGTLGGFLTLSVVKDAANRQIDPWLAVTFIFGVGMAIGSIGAWTSLVIKPIRVMNYFVIAGGGIAAIEFTRRVHYGSIRKGVLLSLLVVGAITVPPHYVSSMEPTYQDGQYSQRFEGDVYASADFVEKADATMFGDIHAQQVVANQVQRPIYGGGPAIDKQDVSDDELVILTGKRNDILISQYQSGIRRAYISSMYERFDSNNSRVYSNGEVAIWA